MEIPFEKLSPEALRGVIEEYVTREGTDYGSYEHNLEEKVRAVEGQVRSRHVRILFNPSEETIHLVPSEDCAQHSLRN